jgi:hypothetical protein
MYLERRRWKLTAVWVEKIMSSNCGYCFAYVMRDMIQKLSSSDS